MLSRRKPTMAKLARMMRDGFRCEGVSRDALRDTSEVNRAFPSIRRAAALKPPHPNPLPRKESLAQRDIVRGGEGASAPLRGERWEIGD